MSLFRPHVRIGRTVSIIDVVLFFGIVAFIYALVGVANEWAGPYRPKTEIDLSFWGLASYAFLSFVRVLLAYILSLAFTLCYGYWAAKSRRAEPILISLLDILQSVPVLGFMPGLVLALVGVFPNSNLGLELAAIVMIFTGQGWNMVFSFYSSLKAVPAELRDMTQTLRLSPLEVLRTVELPFAANGLLWNSMVSMAGGWFFLMVIESFTLGDKDFRLPGIGSYMAVAYEQGDSYAVAAGVLVMFVLIIIVDRFVWAPLVVWSERFKFDRDGHAPVPHSLVWEWLKRSDLLMMHYEILEKIKKAWDRRRDERIRQHTEVVPWADQDWKRWYKAVRVFFLVLGAFAIVFGIRSMFQLIGASTLHDWLLHVRDTFLTFLRVAAATILGALWTVPLGVFIGTNPKWTRRLQPFVQVVASFPAPMLFPILTSAFYFLGISLEFGAVILMLFASQWYILFNVISGATLIPHHMIDVAAVFQVRGLNYWKSIILPAIFPSLVNGLITAAGGAWNACIVAEIVTYGEGSMVATGIGASITRAAQTGNFPALAGAVLVMVTTVVILNRVLWGSLYRLAETRFRLD